MPPIASIDDKDAIVKEMAPLVKRIAYHFMTRLPASVDVDDLIQAGLMGLLDASGKQLCLDDNADYAPVCAVTPRASGEYRIDIGNKSAAKSRTVILSN